MSSENKYPFISDQTLYKAVLFSEKLVKEGKAEKDSIRISARYYDINSTELTDAIAKRRAVDRGEGTEEKERAKGKTERKERKEKREKEPDPQPDRNFKYWILITVCQDRGGGSSRIIKPPEIVRAMSEKTARDKAEVPEGGSFIDSSEFYFVSSLGPFSSADAAARYMEQNKVGIKKMYSWN